MKMIQMWEPEYLLSYLKTRVHPGGYYFEEYQALWNGEVVIFLQHIYQKEKKKSQKFYSKY